MKISKEQSIKLKRFISKSDYEEISRLEKTCISNDRTVLKLDLEYRMSVAEHTGCTLGDINEFLYFTEEKLVGYISISSYGGSGEAEINGMVHPDFRRRGIFKRLFALVVDECRRRRFNKVLLLSDRQSESGIQFIKGNKGIYNVSEYRMRKLKSEANKSTKVVNIKRINDKTKEEAKYIIEHEGDKIGKIRVDYSGKSAYICGFEIIEGERGKGYGRASLKETLRIIQEKGIDDIELDVECENAAALNLYKDCGFVEQSVMDYYEMRGCNE